MNTKQKREETPVLVPAMQAAKKLGISRRTLRRHIGAGLLRSVTVSARTYIPQAEMERIVNGQPVPSQNETKPQGVTENSSSGTDADKLTPDERFHALFEGRDWRVGFGGRLEELAHEEQREREELEQDVAAGDPRAIAAKAAWEATKGDWREAESPERQRATELHRATWRAWREARKAQLACTGLATTSA